MDSVFNLNTQRFFFCYPNKFHFQPLGAMQNKCILLNNIT